MKINGKQIVVELPEKKKRLSPSEYDLMHPMEQGIDDSNSGYNAALSEVAKMNPAWEVDEEKIKSLLLECKSIFKNPHHYTLNEQESIISKDAHALASDLPAWLKERNNVSLL